MNKKEEALKIAIQTFEWINKEYPVQEALDVCKEALKPHPKCDEACMFLCANEKKEWQGLTNEEIELLDFRKNYMEIYHDTDDDGCYFDVDTWEHDFARIIEQKIKEKNS